jgi:hypothetical protein
MLFDLLLSTHYNYAQVVMLWGATNEHINICWISFKSALTVMGRTS